MLGFEMNESYFEDDSLRYWKPVKVNHSSSDMVILVSSCGYPSNSTLNIVQLLQERLGLNLYKRILQ